MKKSKWSLLAMLFALVLVLAACGTDEEEKQQDDAADQAEINDANFASKVTNEGEAIEGGTLMVAMQKDEPFQGIFS